jgi:hypothetical protein
MVPALPAFAAPSWSAPLTITSSMPTEGHLTLIVAGNDTNPFGCASSSWMRLRLISAMLLTAFAQGKPVKMWEANCESDGTNHIVAAWTDK